MEHKTNDETRKCDLVWGKRENERATTSKKRQRQRQNALMKLAPGCWAPGIKLKSKIESQPILFETIRSLQSLWMLWLSLYSQNSELILFFLSSGLTNAFLIHHDCAFFLTPFRYKVILQIWLLSISCKNNHFLFFPGKMVMAFQCSANPYEWREMK